ncbi:calcium/sodium antiporter [Lignipirellula cremea]|uniref:Inner membrane protein YrbG n=1 Tax=Lignipirellula cremea TaxID=2528010 RepID=A0A518E1A0_9BACT|nr:calcium/sodium antiporter [Lignipirellula cremea]QDU97868.1 Inner membrane protein YrbG [Lignipirellula cremea]
MVTSLGLMVLGLLGLVVGGEFLVRAASRLAAAAGISPLVIGLTVVAFGTSAPELAVSVQAAWSGQADMSVGNVVGSNIFNVLFILGVSALLSPLVVSSQLIRIDVPLMIVASAAVLALGWDQRIGPLEGMLLFATLIVYVGWTVLQSRREQASVQQEFQQEFDRPLGPSLGTWSLQLLLLAAGLALLTVGAQLLVNGATGIARQSGMSELLIGLLIIAPGTSLPEVATSILATVRGERDIAVGNVIGSNIFNLLCVLGLSSILAPEGIVISPTALWVDIPIMIAVAAACLPIFFTGHRISRGEGGLFLGYYLAYTTYLVLAAASPETARTFGLGVLMLAAPATFVMLLLAVVRSFRPAKD